MGQEANERMNGGRTDGRKNIFTLKMLLGRSWTAAATDITSKRSSQSSPKNPHVCDQRDRPSSDSSPLGRLGQEGSESGLPVHVMEPV